MTTPTRPRSPAPQPRAFTLIELLVVIVIIGILSTLLLVGIKGLRNTAKRQQTRGALQQCLSMYAAWDAAAPRILNSPRFVPSVMPCPMNMTVDLNPVPSTSPAQADDSTPANRYGSAVWFTRDVMFNLRSLPGNAAALAKLSPGSLMTMPSVLNQTFPAPATVALWTSGTYYQPFQRVYVLDPSNSATFIYYDCIEGSIGHPQGSPPSQWWLPGYPVTTTPPASGASQVATDDTVPVLLDGWGNPIIFVPGGTLGTGAAINSDGSVIPGSGSMTSSAVSAPTGYQVKSPDGRPFFASAGPDGDFSRADDNLYSFEK